MRTLPAAPFVALPHVMYNVVKLPGQTAGSRGRPTSRCKSTGIPAATIFWRFGLDLATELHDANGRSFRLAAGEPIYGLFG